MQPKNFIEIADFLRIDSIKKDINSLSPNDNAELFIPLVGEFNAGKTSLLNALLESCQLPCSNIPTTSTIFQIRFGNVEPSAKLIRSTGEEVEILDMQELSKNETYDNVAMVYINDTSTLVPSNIVLVDSPGISSNFIEHTRAIADFIPHADALFVLVDANTGGITQSLKDFLRVSKVVEKPNYLIFTKAALLSPESVCSIKKASIAQNQFNEVISVDACTGKLDEFYGLISKVIEQKDSIIENSKNAKLDSIRLQLVEYLKDYIQALDSEEIHAPSSIEADLELLNENVKWVLGETSKSTKATEKDIIDEFSSEISAKLDLIVQKKRGDYNLAAKNSIDDAARFVFNKYKQNIQTRLKNLRRTISNWEDSDELVYLVNEISKIDISKISSPDLLFDLDLNSIGHEHDGTISKGVKLLAAAGVAVAAVYTGGAAAGPVLANIDTIADVADTVSDIASIQSNRDTVDKISRTVTKAKGFFEKATNEYNSIEEENLRYGNQFGSDRGIVETIVGNVTESLSRPQRVRAINEYVETVLIPSFKRQIAQIRETTLQSIETIMLDKANELVNNKKKLLQSAKEQWEERSTNKAKAQEYLIELTA
ncbi:MAG: dynamin family protein [Alistipes sp.]|nr:dynamin family protein [Alistipes sp.]